MAKFPIIHDNGVVELDPRDKKATVCGHCERGWDDSISTSVTPVPSARCPFEYDHAYVEEPVRLDPFACERLVRELAEVKIDGDTNDQGEEFELENDDAWEIALAAVNDARKIVRAAG